MLRAPYGGVAGLKEFWQPGKLPYDLGDFGVPVLIIHAEWDADLPNYQAQEYFTKLTHPPYRRFGELGEGTARIP